MIRSGRMRSELRTSSRIGTAPSPSMLGGRDSSRSTWRWLRRSSAASSIVTMRSSSGMRVGHRVEQRRLAAARAARDQDVELRAHAHVDELDSVLAQRAGLDEVVEVHLVLRELPDREQRPGERQRRDDRVDAAAVGQARVDHRRGLVDAPADLRHDLVDDAPQVRLVGELDRRLVELAAALDPDVVRAVDHDLRHGVVGQHPLERAVAERVVEDLVDETLAVRARQAALLRHPLADLDGDAAPERLPVDLGVEQLRPEVGDQRGVDAVLDLGEDVAPVLVLAGGVRPCDALAELHHDRPRRRLPPAVATGAAWCFAA